jgi:myo-inositol 2-dehydrogenase/D-chiro-inositol 1-dehydrogenase
MTVRIGVIGTGMIGRDHTRRIQQVLAGAEVSRSATITPMRREGRAGDLAPARRSMTGEDLIAAAGCGCGAGLTSTGATHEAYVLAAIAAGKPCFLRKAAGHHGRRRQAHRRCRGGHGKRLVQVGFMRRYDAGYVALKQATDPDRRADHGPCRASQPDRARGYGTPMAIHDTLIHEIDVLRWLLDDDYVSARVLFPRKAARAHGKLRDPQVVVLETAKGVLIDVEIFVNCHYGYDIQCEVVGEDGIAKLPEPMAIQMRLDAKLQNPILTDWKDRFVDSYDVELNDFIKAPRRAPRPARPAGTAMSRRSPRMPAWPRKDGEGRPSPSPCRIARRFTLRPLMRFAINHISAPKLPLAEFFAMCRRAWACPRSRSATTSPMSWAA